MELKTQHMLFIEHYIESCDVKAAAVKAGYSPDYGYKLFSELRPHIQDRLSLQLATQQAQAIKVLDESMRRHACDPKQEIKLRAAESVLDRGGLVKKSSIDVTGNALPAVMLLPAKADIEE